jgi:hypothetical protein
LNQSGGGGTADTSPSKGDAERREGSNPSPRTCQCGLQPEAFTEREHYGWHKILMWNRKVFEDAQQKREKTFNEKYGDNRKTRKNTDMSTML